MILRHCTPEFNIASIDADGLLPSRAQTSKRVVWLCLPRLTNWGILHVARRHHVKPEEVRVLTVSVPKGWLRSNSPGLWTCDRVIHPRLISGSPAWFAGVLVAQAHNPPEPIRSEPPERE